MAARHSNGEVLRAAQTWRRRCALAGLVLTVVASTLRGQQTTDDWRAKAANSLDSASPQLLASPGSQAAAIFDSAQFRLERLPPVAPQDGGAVRSVWQAEAMQPPVRLVALQESAPAPPTVPAPESDKPADEEKKPGPQKPGEETRLGRAPESNALQFLRAQDVLLAPGTWQADTGLVYTLFENDFPVPLVDPVTNELVDVVEGDVRRRLLYTPLAARYGWRKSVQLFANLPVGYSNTQISRFGVSNSTNQFGIGDLNAGASIHLIKGEEQLPDVVTTIDFTAPTGDFDAPIFGLVPGSNLGQGFWAMSASALFIHRYDPVIAFYGAGYRHLFERAFDGVLFAPGEQISYQFGVGFSINDRVTLSAAFLGFYLTDVIIDGQTIPGTNLEPLSLRFAATIARNCRIVEPFVMLGMTDSAPAANFGIVVTYY